MVVFLRTEPDPLHSSFHGAYQRFAQGSALLGAGDLLPPPCSLEGWHEVEIRGPLTGCRRVGMTSCLTGHQPQQMGGFPAREARLCRTQLAPVILQI